MATTKKRETKVTIISQHAKSIRKEGEKWTVYKKSNSRAQKTKQDLK
jgi:hypothetical protein